jgi:hypothetical protein
VEELLPKDNENVPLFDPGPLKPSEPEGFTPDQMIVCKKCNRRSPPTRANCIYCATPFAFEVNAAELRKPILQTVEPGEPGYSNIVTPGASTEADTKGVAALLKLGNEQVCKILTSDLPLPIARVSSLDEARLIESRLNDLRVSTFIVADNDLRVEELPSLRVRAAEFDEARLACFQVTTNQSWTIPWTSLRLLVKGRMTVKSLASTERKASGKENEIVDTSETQTDEAVVEIYAAGHQSSFRIAASSFDFSCLGKEKSLLANENFENFLQLMLKRAPSATLDDSYKQVRQLLELVWPLEKRTESKGWRRERIGRVTYGAITQVNNQLQFARYSRLRDYLYQRH